MYASGRFPPHLSGHRNRCTQMSHMDSCNGDLPFVLASMGISACCPHDLAPKPTHDDDDAKEDLQEESCLLKRRHTQKSVTLQKDTAPPLQHSEQYIPTPPFVSSFCIDVATGFIIILIFACLLLLMAVLRILAQNDNENLARSSSVNYFPEACTSVTNFLNLTAIFARLLRNRRSSSPGVEQSKKQAWSLLPRRLFASRTDEKKPSTHVVYVADAYLLQGHAHASPATALPALYEMCRFRCCKPKKIADTESAIAASAAYEWLWLDTPRQSDKIVTLSVLATSSIVPYSSPMALFLQGMQGKPPEDWQLQGFMDALIQSCQQTAKMKEALSLHAHLFDDMLVPSRLCALALSATSSNVSKSTIGSVLRFVRRSCPSCHSHVVEQQEMTFPVSRIFEISLPVTEFSSES